MAGTRAPHSWANPRPLETGAKVIVFSFGQNDAADSAVNYAGSYPVNVGKLHALNWMERARLAGAACVVWVLPNVEASPGSNAYEAMRDWKTEFNRWMKNLVGTVSPTGQPGQSIQLRVVDWDALAEVAGNSQSFGVHPTQQGAQQIGFSIRLQIKTCT